MDIDIMATLASIIPITLGAAFTAVFVIYLIRRCVKTAKQYKTTEPEPSFCCKATVTNKYTQQGYRYYRGKAPQPDDKYMVEFTLDNHKILAFDLPLYYDAFELQDNGMLETNEGDFVNFTLDKTKVPRT